MTTRAENNRRIAQNTLLLYVRMLFMMVVTLYTSRVVLNTLGIEDFGIYNVVGSIVAMFGFINSAMASGTQRYLTFELGKGNFLQLQKIFSTSLLIHGLISVLIVFLAETIGLWFLYHKMVIPAARMDAALWIYQLSILSVVVSIMSVPYNAAIIAHEKMSAFAYISILEVMLQLLIAYLLLIVSFDKLKLYALLIFSVRLIIRLIYSSYCHRHFVETKFRRLWDYVLFKKMMSFAGWNLWGNCAGVALSQGVDLLLNLFFGPAVNAARGVAVQVQIAVSQFSGNFQMAVNPQITKSYAQQDYQYMHSLIYKSSKLTFFMLLFFSLPVWIEANTLLVLWLKNVPDYTVIFLRLILCITMIDAMANSLMVSVSATGNVSYYQFVVGSILLVSLPVSYMVLKLGGNPASVFMVHLCICIIAFMVRLFIVCPMIKLSIRDYINQVVLKCLIVTVTAIALPLMVKIFLPETIWNFLLVCLLCVVCVSVSAYTIGLKVSERIFVRQKLAAILSKIKR